MKTNINAIVAREVDGDFQAKLEQIQSSDLPDLPVLVQVDYSSLNYKDALAVSDKNRICRRLPMVCGIDLAGTVLESSSEQWRAGDRVLVNGYGLSETKWGGYIQQQRLAAECLVARPSSISSQFAMSLGTAGYTSMLCVNALRDHGIKPADGPILVTGASGGVGSVAIVLLVKLGYDVVAVSGRSSTHEYLRGLGASKVLNREEFDRDAKFLEAENWSGVIDSVGAKTLATAIAQTKYEGLVAACGLAGGVGLPASVMPFILRGVTLRGVDSVHASQAKRQRAWNDLAELLTPEDLQDVTQVQPMSQLPKLALDLLEGRLQGRVVIDVNA
jgi:acrylyl-CoA reductase (NADPH)